MTNPALWLDIIVAIVAAVGLVFGLLTLCEQPGPRRGCLKLCCTYCIAGVFFLGGSDAILTRQLAQRSSAVGFISGLQEHGGKNKHSTFTLTDSTGRRFFLGMDATGDPLRTTGQVKAEWITYSLAVTRLDVLTGPKTGEHLNDSAPFLAFVDMALGIWLAWMAPRVRRRNPDAYPKGNADEQPPLNGVDPESLLNLNRQ